MTGAKVRRSQGLRALGALALGALLGCSDRSGPTADEFIGQVSDAVIAPSSQNIPVALTTNHELALTYVKGAGGPVGGSGRGRWVAATNNDGDDGSACTFDGICWS